MGIKQEEPPPLEIQIPGKSQNLIAMDVGATVRAPRDKEGKRTGRATIASIDEDGKLDLIWEDTAPRPLHGSFIIAPTVESMASGQETTTNASSVQELFPFEKEGLNSNEVDIGLWKQRGDTLLKAGDAASAIPFYERALSVANKVQVGCTVLILRGQTVSVAEVDCVEEDTVDVTWTEHGTDESIPISHVTLVVSVFSTDIQIRVLLNLGRSLMHLAEVDNTPLSRPSAYRQSACAAFSMVLAMIQTEDSEEVAELIDYNSTALLLRSKAYATRGKLKRAIEDANALLKHSPASKEGKKWSRDLQQQVFHQQKANKKLVKSMSRWIQTVMNSSSETQTVSETKEGASVVDPSRKRNSHWMHALAVVGLAMLIHAWLMSNQQI